jgi:adenosylcobyric acid synthase
MFVGTASDVGKSVITAGFCRIFRQDGYCPAPFKAQNMSLNSYATPEGLEIGRAQAVQAEAAGIPCHVDMNPVLLKPTSDQAAQVVLNGRPIGTQSAYEYFRENDRHELFAAATQAFDRLASRYSPVVLEGAGSISELNLKRRDITNLRMARHAGAATYLIADIDRGGVFGTSTARWPCWSPRRKPASKVYSSISFGAMRGCSTMAGSSWPTSRACRWWACCPISATFSLRRKTRWRWPASSAARPRPAACRWP